MLEIRPPASEIYHDPFTPLVQHIEQGLGLLVDGHGKEAYWHFLAHVPGYNGDPGWRAGMGMGMQLPSLHTEKDLVAAASYLGTHSRASARNADIAIWFVDLPGSSEKIETNPSRYQPELVKRFYYEMGLMGAEEWLHMWQGSTGHHLTSQKDAEADIAAFFDQRGITLSLDFLTRYPQRIEWFVSKYPEKLEEIRAFSAQYRRYLPESLQN